MTFKSIASKNISDEEKSDLIDEKQIKLESKISNAIFIQLAISSVLTILIILSIIKINLFLIYIFSITFFNVFQSISEYFRQYFGNYFNKRFGNCILVFNMFIFPFIIFTIVYAFYNAHKIVNSPKIISIEYNDNTIFKCNKIGKSNNYIFVYYPDSLKSSSISLAEVKKINYYLK
ncbi:MAG: hypothetical protein EAZ27_12145 [Cytophagales bacterium]|nr:MAG: hypothetical protein EAZ27_12145 [Cytophagales bacterium]